MEPFGAKVLQSAVSLLRITSYNVCYTKLLRVLVRQALSHAEAGVGTLGVIDDDTVDITNLQRQIILV